MADRGGGKKGREWGSMGEGRASTPGMEGGREGGMKGGMEGGRRDGGRK